MKKSFFAVIPALLFASCSFWNEPVEEFFSYWSSEAYVTDSSVKVPKQSDSEGIISVPSDKNAEVILNIANPKNFNLVMPSAGNTEMIHFNAFDPQPVFGTDYMIEKLSSKALKLTYTAQFLKKHEWGQKDLGASITMFADDGREFKKNYTFKIKSNTMPPTPTVILAKTREGAPHYVLCLTVPDMDAQVNGKKLHKDIAQIVINESSYELKINDLGLDFVKPTDESFITRADVVQLTGAEAVPTGKWILYYKTDREVGGAYKEYTVTLKDQRGLSSEKLETGTTTNKPAEETVVLNTGTQDSGGDGSNALPFIIQAAGTAPEAQIIISCTSSGTTVHCTVTDVNTGTSNEYNGNPANVPLGLNGGNEKLYEVKYNTKGYGYNPTTLKTKYYKILKLHTVTFNANGGKFADNMATSTATALHGRKVTAPSVAPTRDEYVLVGWYKEQNGTTEWGFDSDTIMEDTTLYAKWTDDVCTIKPNNPTQAWRELKTEVESGTRSVIVIDGEIKATNDSGNSGEITIGRNLTIQGKTGATTDKLNANGQNHRIFKVTGGKTLTLKNLTLKGGKGEVGGNGGGIYAEGTLNMTDCTVTDNETDYGNGGGIYAESDLTMTRCTVSNNTVSDSSGLGGGIYIYVTGTHTMTNCTVTNNEAKYSHGGGIYAMGTLSMMNCTVTGNTAQSSGSGSGSGGGIYIDGTASLTMTGGTVTGNEAQSNGNGGGIYIGGTGSFTMTSGTVNNNKTAHGDGGGIYINGTASLTMTGGTLAGNEAVNNKTGGGVYVNGTFTMKGTAYVTPSTGTEANERGKNDVYLHDDAKIMLSAALTGTAPAARITVPHIKYDSATKVLAGTAALLNSEHSKFTVTPQTVSGGTQEWIIKNDGHLEKAPITVSSADTLAWKKLKDAVAAADGGDVFIIDGEIKATNDTDNSGEIEVKENITIQGKKTDRTDTLNANSTTTDSDAPSQKHRIFKVEPGKKLTLENLTLKNGKNNETDPGGSPKPNGKGGAIYSKGELEIRNVLITGCEAKYSGGGIYCSMSASSADDERKLVIENTDVTSCKASESTYGAGGGVYIVGENCLMKVKLSYVKIKNNEAKYSAAGLCLYGSHNATTTADSVVLTSVTLRENELTGTSAAGGAGMVFATYASNNAIKLKNCTVTKNESKTFGGGISLCTSRSGSVNGKLILENSSVTENKAQNGGGVYVNWSNLVMKNTVLTSNTATMEGGGVYVEAGTFTMNDSSRITPSSGADENAIGKNEVFLKNGKMITVDGTLTGTAPVARITPAAYATTTQALTGSITAGTSPNQNYTKFTVTPQILSDGKILYWEVDAAGKLMRIVDGTKYPNSAWKALKDVVSVAGADPITINGRIQATDDADNKGTININGPITIKGKNGRDTDILDAGKKGGRIFIINDSLTNKLTLEKLTLKGGFVNGNDGAAILVGRDAEAELSACTIEECEALNGGAIAIWATGTATLKNTDIKNCSAKLFSGNTPPNGSGGAVYAAGGTVIMTNCTLTGNTAENNGGAVYAKKTSDLTPILSTVTIEGGTIGGAGTNANKATGTGEGLGGGIYIGESCVLNMKDYTDSSNNKHGAKVISNTAKAKGGAIYTKGGKVTITNCTLKGNEAKTGGAICAEKDGSTGSTVTITGGTIGGTTEDEANKAAGTDSGNGFGGAVFVKGATVNINGCTLEGNKAKNGGGVYMEGGNCTLNGSLKNNKTTELASSSGGGIYLKNGTLTMKTGAEISGSEASVSGGGVYISARDGGTASFTMEGGTISGCKVSSAYEVYGGGVCVEVEHGSTGTANFIMQGGSITGCEASSGGGLSGFTCGGGVCVKNRATFNMTGGSITGCKAVINDNAGTPEAQGGGVHIDEHSTFNMSGTSSITGCTAESSASDPSGSPSFYGGGVYAAGSTATFTMKDSAVITPPSEVHSGMNRFNDVYLNSDAKITVAGSLTPPDGTATRITPAAYNTSTQVLTGGAVDTEHGKFTVTPKDLGSGNTQQWEINSTGFLQKTPVVIDCSGDAWKKLKAAVTAAEDGDVIIIDGAITATNGSGDNKGKIDITKNITIQGKTEAASDILNANRGNLNSNAHPIFRVSDGKTLTLKNLTLKGGKGISGTFGGAINITGSGSKTELTDCIIQDCIADKGGAIGCGSGTTVKLTNSTLTGNQATNGGGVYVSGSSATFTMKGSSCVTPSTGEDVNKPGKNDVYLDGDSKITVADTLTGTPPVARITVADDKYDPSTQVLTADSGVTLANETYKFAVTPKGSEQWTVDGNGYLKQGRYTEVPHGQLAAYLANASSTEVNYIEVTGSIPAAHFKSASMSPPSPGALGQLLKNNASKKVALKLPDGLSDVTSMRGCFAVCRNLISVENIPSNVTDMCCCFYYCESLITAPDIPSGVTDMTYCFDSCTALTTAPNIPATVKSMTFCFKSCTSLTTVPNIPATVESMTYCFNGCKSLTQCPDIPSSVTDMRYCFQNCKKLQSIKMNCHYASGTFNDSFSGCDALPNGGIKVPSGQLTNYKTNADSMGTTEDKFSAF